MEFNNIPPKWDATGTEPSADLQTSGFKAGYKPPAAYFNYLINKITACLKELQSKLKGHAEDTNNPHGVTKEQVGLGNVNNTSDASKPISTAQATAIEAAKKAGTDAQTALTTHASNTDNPHKVTKEQVGLDNVPNVATNDQTPTYSDTTTLTTLVSGEKLNVAFQKIKFAITTLINHVGNTNNPHSVTKAQVDLGNVPNVATNDQTPTYSDTTTLATLSSGEKLNVALQKTKLAITTLINHVGNNSNPHNVTAAQVGARSDTWTPSSSDVFGLAANNFYNITDYKDLKYGISEGVYSGLKTNDPFSVEGAKRVWAMRTRGSGSNNATNGCIIVSCLEGGNDSGRTFVCYVDANGTLKWFELFGNHNKPYGSYSGNNSTTSRTISVGGLGENLVITSDKGTAWVSSRGAICMDRQTGEVSGLKSWEVYYKDRVLTIATNSAFVNASQSYWYQVL